MKVLLDENLDQRLRSHMSPHDAFTAGYMGWAGLKNGKLLRAAETNGFHALLTGDRTLTKEQNLSGRRLAVIVLSTVEWRLLKHHVPLILAALDAAGPGSVHTVDCGVFSRKDGRRGTRGSR